jgi:hypothetical protein
MKNLLKLALVAVFLCVSVGPAMADNRDAVPLHRNETMAQTSGERAPGSFDPAAYAAEQRAKAARLEAVEVGAGFDHPLVVTVTQDDLDAIERGDLEERRYRVGIVKAVSARVDLAEALPDATSSTKVLRWGAIRSESDGNVWSAAVASPGATAIRLHIKDFDLPEGAELWLYNRFGEAFGPFTGKGPDGDGVFWANTVAGSEVLLQVRHHGATETLKAIYFEINEVAYLGDRFIPGRTRTTAAKAFCSYNEPCVENASCPGSDSAVNQARDAVAYMLFRSGGFYYICTGGLIADSDPGSEIPYFLTANHCISKGREANTLETTFFYWSPCNTCNTVMGPGTLGASIVSASRTSDYTLLRLNQNAPSGAAFLGWNSTPVAFANGTHLYRISHPAGAPQAYSEHDVDTSKGTCSSWPRGNWIYSQDIVGATEGGSSGSPVVNGDGQIVGQLSGACGFNVNDPCDGDSNATVDGAFAAYYSSVAQYLGPGSSCGDSDGDGYNAASCGGTDCNDSNSAVNPGATEDCSDGIDNDCDGFIDGSDSDCTINCDIDGDGYDGSQCQGGTDCNDLDPAINPGASENCNNGTDDNCNGLIDGADPECASTCSPLGTMCSTDSDCCSNKCRGRAGNMMCR